MWIRNKKISGRKLIKLTLRWCRWTDPQYHIKHWWFQKRAHQNWGHVRLEFSKFFWPDSNACEEFFGVLIEIYCAVTSVLWPFIETSLLAIIFKHSYSNVQGKTDVYLEQHCNHMTFYGPTVINYSWAAQEWWNVSSITAL